MYVSLSVWVGVRVGIPTKFIDVGASCKIIKKTKVQAILLQKVVGFAQHT